MTILASRVSSVAALLGNALLDFAFPRLCPVCGRPSDRPRRQICWHCFSEIPLHLGPVCTRCGRHPDGAVDADFLCSACRDAPPQFDIAVSAAAFRGGLRHALHAFKYGHATWLCGDLADLLEGCVRGRLQPDAIDVIVPVPLHGGKRRQRSYNQAALLSAALSRRLGVPAAPESVCRRRMTPSQTHLSAASRRANMAGAFDVTEPGMLRGRTVLLVDDVMTTGATLSSLAGAVAMAGAGRIWAATVARG